MKGNEFKQAFQDAITPENPHIFRMTDDFLLGTTADRNVHVGARFITELVRAADAESLPPNADDLERWETLIVQTTPNSPEATAISTTAIRTAGRLMYENGAGYTYEPGIGRIFTTHGGEFVLPQGEDSGAPSTIGRVPIGPLQET